jgi:glycosyltransferase involved in cell wall biosynthesis
MQDINVVHISDTDVPGGRFNGFYLTKSLNQQRGYHATQLVIGKESSIQDKSVVSIFQPPTWEIREILVNFEERLSMNNLVYPFGIRLMNMPEFRQADLVHYHLIHNRFISLLHWPELMQAKPSIWTIHDPWAFTGHCIHPMECNGWMTGCRECPRLDAYFPMAMDKASQMWRIKKEVYAQINPTIVVASEFMRNFVQKSPLTAHFDQVHLIPFGIDLTVFGVNTRAESRDFFQIDKENIVLAFRAHDSEYKGLEYIYEALSYISSPRPLTLLTVGETKIPRSLAKRFHTVELSWVTDESMISKFYSACDIFLMPSVAEAFGLMAIEAMASSRPVVVFEGTALSSVTFAPECGVSVPPKDSRALAQAINRLISNPLERRWRGQRGRALVQQNYALETHLKRVSALYERIFQTQTKG